MEKEPIEQFKDEILKFMNESERINPRLRASSVWGDLTKFILKYREPSKFKAMMKKESKKMQKEHKKLLELEKRGYDLTTFKLKIKKKRN